MKITNELKNLIWHRVAEMRRREEDRVRIEREDFACAKTEELMASPEWKALQEASVKFCELHKAMLAENPALKSSSYPINYADDRYRYPSRYAFYGSLEDIHIKYDTMYDSIILKLSYGKDFDEAKNILAEFGIEI